MISWAVVLLVFFGSLIALALRDQFVFRRQKGSLPGPSWIPPFIGNLFPMIMGPVQFYRHHASLGPVSVNNLVGKFFVYCTDTKLIRKVFFSPEKFTLFLTLGAKPILGEKHNIAFMNGDPHRALRRRILPLFTPRALACYLDIQEKVIRDSIKQWQQLEGVVKFQPLARDLTIASSQAVFVGPYVRTDEERKEFSRLFSVINQGLLSLPFNLPGMAFRKAIKARESLIKMLKVHVEESKENMREGKEPSCMLDFWMEEELKAAERGETTYDDEAISFHVLDFLFASQDASTSSLVWTTNLMADYPDIFARVKEEQARVRASFSDPIGAVALDDMAYTKMVVREILRFRPPVPFVPHVAEEDTELREGCVVPKGGIIFPDLIAASRQGFSNPETFDPERFNEDRREQDSCADNFLIFGCGPHLCLGRQYAMNQLALFTALMATEAKWEHVLTKTSNEIKYLPTVVPDDDGLVRFTKA